MDRISAAKVFVAIVDCSSMIAAAKALDMSRSMVTRYLAEIETWVGARLLHRSTRRLSLTPVGEQTLIQCRQLLAIAEDMPVANSSVNNSPSGLLRISCSQSLAQEVLPTFVQQYLERYPLVSIDLQVSNQAVNLVEERIDLALRITNNLDPNLIARPLGQCASVVCATGDYINQRGIPLHIDELSQHNCLTYTYFGKSLWQFQYKGEPVSATVSGNFSANESMVLLKATLAGAGIALLPKYAVESYLADGRLINLLPEYEPHTLDIYGLYRSRKHMPLALRTLLDMLIEYCSTIKM